MADTQTQTNEVPKTKSELVAQNQQNLVATPRAVIQSTFPEQMRQGLPGMINRMVDYNAVTRSVATAAGIPPARAVSQSVAADIDCSLGGTVVGFVGISILDPTLVNPVGSALADGVYPQYSNIGVLTKGEIFATATVITAAGDPVHFGAADGVLTNTGGIGPVVGARWKYSRPANELNVVQLGIQR